MKNMRIQAISQDLERSGVVAVGPWCPVNDNLRANSSEVIGELKMVPFIGFPAELFAFSMAIGMVATVSGIKLRAAFAPDLQIANQ